MNNLHCYPIIPQSHRPIRAVRNLLVFECCPSTTRQRRMQILLPCPSPLTKSWASPGRCLFSTTPYFSLLWQPRFDRQGRLFHKATFLSTYDKWGNSVIFSTAQSCYRFATSQSSWWDHVFCLRLSSTWDKNGFFYFCYFFLVHFVLRKKNFKAAVHLN